MLSEPKGRAVIIFRMSAGGEKKAENGDSPRDPNEGKAIAPVASDGEWRCFHCGTSLQVHQYEVWMVCPSWYARVGWGMQCWACSECFQKKHAQCKQPPGANLVNRNLHSFVSLAQEGANYLGFPSTISGR